MESIVKFSDEVLHLRAEHQDKGSCALIVGFNAHSLGVCGSGLETASDCMKKTISYLTKSKC